MSKVGVRETILRHSANIGLTKYWAEEVVTVWNMTHTCWLEDSGEVTLITSKRLEKLCDFIKANESLPLKAIAEKYCLKNLIPFITEDKKKVYLRLADDSDTRVKLAQAEEIITKLSACLSSHANNSFENELLAEAEKFLEDVRQQ